MHPQGADRQSTQTWAHLASLDPTLAKSLAEARTSTARSRRRLAVLPNIDDRSIFKLFFFAMDFVSTETAPKKTKVKLTQPRGCRLARACQATSPGGPRLGLNRNQADPPDSCPLAAKKNQEPQPFCTPPNLWFGWGWAVARSPSSRRGNWRRRCRGFRCFGGFFCLRLCCSGLYL